jgi:hypothetical protein
MSTNGLRPDPPGREHFNENSTRYPPEDLLKYANQYVAWAADGTRILTSGATWQEVEDRLAAMGIAGDQVVFQYVPDLETTYF